jgi:hypothetical protein
VVLGASLLLASCSSKVAINQVVASGDGTRLDVGLNSCGGTYAVAVGESLDVVSISATDQRSPIRFSGTDCEDHWTVELSEPIGDRRVIDGNHGSTLHVHYDPWNQLRYTEAEYRAALDAAVECILAADPSIDAMVAESADGPRLEVSLGDLPQGESRSSDPSDTCIAEHVDPLRR